MVVIEFVLASQTVAVRTIVNELRVSRNAQRGPDHSAYRVAGYHDPVLPGVVYMTKCATCHNEYDKCFEVTLQGRTYTFDSFECAIQKLAPACSHCSCRIIGHGVESDGRFFCCAHCAHDEGIFAARDRVEAVLPLHTLEGSDTQQV